MREAAYQAGIGNRDNPEQVLIALEPEAASVYCRKLKMSQLVPERQKFAFSDNLSRPEAASHSSQDNTLVLDDSGTGKGIATHSSDNRITRHAKYCRHSK